MESIKDNVPGYRGLINPMLAAFRALGGSGTVEEIKNQIIEDLEISNAVADLPHDRETSNQTELEYQLTRARTYMRRADLIKNSSADIWVLKPEYRSIERVDPSEVIEKARCRKNNDASKNNLIQPDGDQAVVQDRGSWKSELRTVLTETLSPSAFERLTRRLLRELGFKEVEITDRFGDEGIDGQGLMKVNEVVSFQIVFQCKRYKGTVGATEIRDFRGAMTGRADRGLVLTTGSFSREARKEAKRDGVAPIDLIDGEELADKLKDHELGIETRVVERVVVDTDWFSKI